MIHESINLKYEPSSTLNPDPHYLQKTAADFAVDVIAQEHVVRLIQGYLAHKKTPIPLGPP